MHHQGFCSDAHAFIYRLSLNIQISLGSFAFKIILYLISFRYRLLTRQCIIVPAVLGAEQLVFSRPCMQLHLLRFSSAAGENFVL